jgi:surfactin synthase thioesterase subunit
MSFQHPSLVLLGAGAPVAARLLCFPYAGGSATAFKPWCGRFPPHVEVLGVQLAGRGTRFGETPRTTVAAVIAELGPVIGPRMDVPTVFFGHSLGAVVAFEVCRWLRQHRFPMPRHLFVSGRNGPESSRATPYHAMDDAQFIAAVRTLNGTPPEVFGSRDLLGLVLPTLRADFTLSETYRCSVDAPLDVPISALAGRDDPDTSVDGLEGWRPHTSGAFRKHILAGEHFFLRSSERAVLAIVREAFAGGASGRAAC